MISGDAILIGGSSASVIVNGLLSTDSVIATLENKTRVSSWDTDHFAITNLDTYGIWTITATRSGTSYTKTLVVDAATAYTITFSIS